MEEKYIIGVDNGTQSTKVYIFNPKGEIVASASQPLRPMMARKLGYVEHPDDDLWDSIKATCKELMSKFEGDPGKIVGLGLCTIRCCRVFMKADGNLAAPVMSWMDVRSYEKYEDSPEIAYTSPTTGYVTQRLTGRFVDTAANAFQWQFPLDMDTWEWSADAEYFNSFGIPREKLLELQLPGTILGHVTAEAAEATGLPHGIPVVATANDKAVEALGSGLLYKNVSLISLGTYIASMVTGKENLKNPQNFWVNLASMPYRYLYESNGIRRGMWHVSWIRDLMGEDYAKRAKEQGKIVEQLLEEEAVNVPAGSDGLITIPDWLAPADQLYRKGVMIGFDERHSRGHMYRSIVEGIAFTLKTEYDKMINELGIRPERIIISGGGSNSDMTMQIYADMYGVTTVRNVMNGAAALGAAICAAVATGVYGSYEDAVTGMVRCEQEFHSDPSTSEFYKKIHERIYKKLPGLMEPALKNMHDVFSK